MNIIITGKKNIGKSTILDKIIKEYPGSVSGFKTHFDDRNDINSRALYMSDLADSSRTKVVSWCMGERTPDFCAFDKAGTSLLCENTSLIVMDELGIFESEAYGFEKAVKDKEGTETWQVK